MEKHGLIKRSSKKQHHGTDDLQTTMLLRRADQLFSALIKRRDNNQCRVCRKPGSDCSHIVTRNALKLRYDPENALTLCRECHRKLHDFPKESSATIDQIFFDGYTEKLQNRAKSELLEGSKKHFLIEIIRNLEDQHEKETQI